MCLIAGSELPKQEKTGAEVWECKFCANKHVRMMNIWIAAEV